MFGPRIEHGTFNILLHGPATILGMKLLGEGFLCSVFFFPENFPHFMAMFSSRYPNILLKYLVCVNILYDTTETLTSGEKNNTKSMSIADLNYSEFVVTQKATGDHPNFESLHFFESMHLCKES